MEKKSIFLVAVITAAVHTFLGSGSAQAAILYDDINFFRALYGGDEPRWLGPANDRTSSFKNYGGR